MYICSQKEKTNSKNCSVSNVHGNTLVQLVCNEVLAYTKPDSSVYIGLQKLRDSLESNKNKDISEIEMLESILSEKKSRIDKLITSLSKSDGNDTFIKYIEQQVNQLDKECKEIESRISSTSKTFYGEMNIENLLHGYIKLT